MNRHVFIMDFYLRDIIEIMDIFGFIDGRVNFRNSGVNGLIQINKCLCNAHSVQLDHFATANEMRY